MSQSAWITSLYLYIKKIENSKIEELKFEQIPPNCS